jgi:tetratricopeptide (TPR) repeat protein
LRAACYRLLDQADKAAAEQRRADDPATPTTALDQFLLGESYRTRAAVAADRQPQERDPAQAAPALLQAIDAYKLALRQDANHYWSRFQLGRCYLSLGQQEQALEALTACVDLRPKAPWAYSVRGLALALGGRFPDAEQDLKQALDLDPDFGPARLNLGVACLLEKNYDAALEHFGAVLDVPADRRLIEAAYYRGMLYMDQRKVDKAVEDFSRVVKEQRDFRPAYLALAEADLIQDKGRACLDDLNAFLRAGDPQLDLDSAAALGQRGRLLRHLAPRLSAALRPKASVLALGELQQAVKRGGHSAELFDDLGAVRESLGQPKQAIDAYSRGLEVAPEDPLLRIKRGWVYAGDKKYDKAQDDFAVAARLEPRTPAQQLALAEAHTGLGYVQACRQAAVEAQQEATRTLLALKGVDHYGIRHNLACIYGELSRADNGHRAEHEQLALDFLREAVALARQKGAAAEEFQQIRVEPAFPESLRRQAGFKEIVAGDGH